MVVRELALAFVDHIGSRCNAIADELARFHQPREPWILPRILECVTREHQVPWIDGWETDVEPKIMHDAAAAADDTLKEDPELRDAGYVGCPWSIKHMEGICRQALAAKMLLRRPTPRGYERGTPKKSTAGKAEQIRGQRRCRDYPQECVGQHR